MCPLFDSSHEARSVSRCIPPAKRVSHRRLPPPVAGQTRAEPMEHQTKYLTLVYATAVAVSAVSQRSQMRLFRGRRRGRFLNARDDRSIRRMPGCRRAQASMDSMDSMDSMHHDALSDWAGTVK